MNSNENEINQTNLLIFRLKFLIGFPYTINNLEFTFCLESEI